MNPFTIILTWLNNVFYKLHSINSIINSGVTIFWFVIFFFINISWKLFVNITINISKTFQITFWMPLRNSCYIFSFFTRDIAPSCNVLSRVTKFCITKIIGVLLPPLNSCIFPIYSYFKIIFISNCYLTRPYWSFCTPLNLSIIWALSSTFLPSTNVWISAEISSTSNPVINLIKL